MKQYLRISGELYFSGQTDNIIYKTYTLHCVVSWDSVFVETFLFILKRIKMYFVDIKMLTNYSAINSMKRAI